MYLLYSRYIYRDEVQGRWLAGWLARGCLEWRARHLAGRPAGRPAEPNRTVLWTVGRGIRMSAVTGGRDPGQGLISGDGANIAVFCALIFVGLGACYGIHWYRRRIAACQNQKRRQRADESGVNATEENAQNVHGDP